MDDDSIAFYNA